MLRKEVLFYHNVLENSVDHFLQALFAANFTYFPSRKRSAQYIRQFMNKPDDCYDRLLQMIKHSVLQDTLDDSVNELKHITMETEQIGKKIFK